MPVRPCKTCEEKIMSMISPEPVEPTLAARIERAAYLVYLHGAKEGEVAEALGIKGVTLRDWKRRPA